MSALSSMSFGDTPIKSALLESGIVEPTMMILRCGTALQKSNASALLCEIARDASLGAHVTVPLIHYFRKGSTMQQDSSCCALQVLAKHGVCPDVKRLEECLSQVVKYIAQGPTGMKAVAADLVGDITKNDVALQNACRLAGVVPPLVELMRSGSADETKVGIGALLRLMDEHSVNRVRVVECGGIAPLVCLARDGTSHQQELAVSALTSLSSSESKSMVEAGAVDVLVRSLCSSSASKTENSLRALCNVAWDRDTSNNPSHVIKADHIVQVIELLRTGNAAHKLYAAQLLHNFAKSSAEVRARIAEGGGVAALVCVLHYGSFKQEQAAMAALQSVLCAVQSIAVPSSDVLALMDLLRQGTELQKDSAFKLLVRVSDVLACRQTILDGGGVAVFAPLLLAGTEKQKQQSLQVLSKLAFSERNRLMIGGTGVVTAAVNFARRDTTTSAIELITQLAYQCPTIAP